MPIVWDLKDQISNYLYDMIGNKENVGAKFSFDISNSVHFYLGEKNLLFINNIYLYPVKDEV